MKILIIEDDKKTAEFIEAGLSKHGYETTLSHSGGDGFALALQGAYDVLVVDRMLPIMDGLSIVEKLRAAEVAIPILFLSALGEVDDRVDGLKAGADDYLPKPFAMPELIARVDALVRRSQSEQAANILKVGDLEMQLLSRDVSRDGEDIDLKPREFRLLKYLMRNSNQVITRMMLLEKVWDYHFDPQTNVIDVHVSRLRSKIDKPFEGPPMLETVRGTGYMLRG
ncbi:MAG: two-component system OmpR family response regulator [Saprospiraceae bacterium]|jgi:two-component system OmpR family response regulator